VEQVVAEVLWAGPSMRFSTALNMPRLGLLVAALGVSGCFAPGDGIEPPLDQLYFPVNLTTDESKTHLFVVNSNFDLQYNGGTLQSFDLNRLRELVPRACESDGDCAGVAGTRCDLEPSAENGGTPERWCVPTEGPFAGKPCGPLGEKSVADRMLAPGRCGAVNPSAPQDGLSPLVVDAVGIGAFATDLIYRKAPPLEVVPDAPSGRLFVPVRGDTTLHWIDVADDGTLECGQDSNDGECDDTHRRGDDPAEESTRNIRLDPEPYGLDATADGGAIAVTHQSFGRVSLFLNDWGQRGPLLEFVLSGLPERPIGIAAIPEPQLVARTGIAYDPGFLVTFRDAAEIRLLRFVTDAAASPARPFLAASGGVGIRANSVGFDSRGIAIDPGERQICERGCANEPNEAAEIECLRGCPGKQLGVYVANRTPASLLVGLTRPNQSPTSSDDLPNIFASDPMPFGPSRVTIGQVIDRNNELQTRVFLICFDSRVIVPFNPATGEAEEAFFTGRGPHAFHVDTQAGPGGHALGYVGHFTDSYIGVIDLDQRHRTYGQIVLTVGAPLPPRASK
jgi:hypothetical protein